MVTPRRRGEWWGAAAPFTVRTPWRDPTDVHIERISAVDLRGSGCDVGQQESGLLWEAVLCRVLAQPPKRDTANPAAARPARAALYQRFGNA
jgi:hypothetical protein